MAAGRGPGRPPASNSERTKARILETAREVFSELGYQATTYREIAERCDLSRPAINHYFPTKRDLYSAVVASVHTRLIAAGLAQAQEKPSFEARIRAFIDAQARDPEAAAFLVISVLEAKRNPELADAGDGALDASRMFIGWVLGEAAAAGRLNGDPEDPHLVEMLVALLCGLSFYAGFGDDGEQLAAITDRFLTLLCGVGILKTP